MIYYEKEVERKYVFKGRIINVRTDTVLMPDGGTQTREIVEHNGGVAIIPIDDDGTVYLVRQYRRTIDRDILEIPAGKLELGESHLECGIRELKEETGLSAREMIYLCGTLPSPGYVTETIHLYLARGLSKGAQSLDNDEYLNVEHYHIDELIRMAAKGRIIDSKTLNAIFLAREHLSK